LEGGYSKEALAKSSEAVIRTLMSDPDDETSFNKILEDSKLVSGETQGIQNSNLYEGELNFKAMSQNATDAPRESFQKMAKYLYLLHKETWGEVLKDPAPKLDLEDVKPKVDYDIGDDEADENKDEDKD